MRSSTRGTRSDGPHERPPEPSSAKAFRELETHLQSRLVGRVREFRLEVQARGLILRGRARTYYAKQLAQHAVMEATDLPILANVITVAS